MARVLRSLGAVLGISGAAYYGKTGYDVHLTSQEVDRIASQHAAESSAVTQAETRLQREVALAASLHEKLDSLGKDLDKWDVQIKEAQARLDELVTGRESAADQSAHVVQEIGDSQARSAKFLAEKAKHEENAQLCSHALVEARQLAEETKKMYNPMNQPLVKNLLSQIQS